MPPAECPAGKVSEKAGKDWWIWVGGSLLLSFLLFCMCYSCNPATTAADAVWGKVHAGLAKEINPELHPFLSVLMSFVFNKLFAVQYAEMKGIGLLIAFIVFVLVPLVSSLLWALLGHPLFMIGGAPGGWRMTWKCYGLHRVACDGATFLVLLAALWLPLPATAAGSMILLLLPLIRVASLVYLWVILTKAHSLGALRIVFFAIPNVVVVSFFSCLFALAAAFWFYAYLLAKSF